MVNKKINIKAYQTGLGVSGHPCPVGAKIVIKR